VISAIAIVAGFVAGLGLVGLLVIVTKLAWRKPWRTEPVVFKNEKTYGNVLVRRGQDQSIRLRCTVCQEKADLLADARLGTKETQFYVFIAKHDQCHMAGAA